MYENRSYDGVSSRGNVIDLAVGFIIGQAFTNVVQSLVTDIITPPFGLLFDNVDFSNLTVKMRLYHNNKPPVLLKYGHFIQQVLYFIIVGFALFLIITIVSKIVKRMKKIREKRHQNKNEMVVIDEDVDKNAKEELVENEQLIVLKEIRDLLLLLKKPSMPNVHSLE
ncbi:unnamed protein product [Didymodactylos carnosus]|uniref:Large-conductance mechanosensitive channel n=1 Tax=Didymodactylos carnosus TaxID=1234261 RepID=A0A815MKE6_9BILA|nr:unnamed protein product [Didymodactylos carnosus]CAF1433964.1 unnamed protein product [Didymodactylos carnosus]CAF4231611.1 unnamed protein product [Didymodactylos carnosus]CAF4305026.1 unnamed protein product [Didymodactylos carnosus]